MGAFLRTFFALFLCSGLLTAQNIHPGQVHELATFAPTDGDAERIASAINANGDVFLTCQAAIHPAGHADEALRRIEGTFLRRISATTWRVFPTVVLGESDSATLGANQVYAPGDQCSRPDLVAVGNHFIATWTRRDSSGIAAGRLECAFIEIDVTGDAMVHSAVPGVGYLIEDGLDPLHSELAPSLAAMPDGSNAAALVYAVHIGSTSDVGGIMHDFELRGTTIDFASIGSAPSVTASESLDLTLAFDEDASSPLDEGAINPDCAFDPFGNLVVSYSDWRADFRLGVGWGNRGRLEVSRYSLTAGNFALLNNQAMVVRHFTNMQRYASLQRSPLNQAVSLACLEVDPDTGNTEAAHYNFDYPDAVSAPNVTDHGVGLTSTWFPSFPQALQHHAARVVLATLNYPGFGKAMVFKRSSGPWTNITKLNAMGPWRSSLGHLEVDAIQPNRGWLAIGAEGHNGADVRCHVMLVNL